MESRPHGRNLQAPIYSLPDGSVEGYPDLILNCALNHVRFRALALNPMWFRAACRTGRECGIGCPAVSRGDRGGELQFF